MEHPDLVLAVWDGLPVQGRGGTAEMVGWVTGYGENCLPGVGWEARCQLAAAL